MSSSNTLIVFGRNSFNFYDHIDSKNYGNYLNDMWNMCKAFVTHNNPDVSYSFLEKYPYITKINADNYDPSFVANYYINGNIMQAKCVRDNTTIILDKKGYKNLTEKGPRCPKCNKHRMRPNVRFNDENYFSKRKLEKLANGHTIFIDVDTHDPFIERLSHLSKKVTIIGDNENDITGDVITVSSMEDVEKFLDKATA